MKHDNQQPKDVLRDEPSAPTLQQVISVLEWASAGDWEHAMDCVKEALSLLAQLSPVPPSEGLIKEAEETMKQLVCEHCDKKIYAETSYIHEDNDMYCDDGNFPARPQSLAPKEATPKSVEMIYEANLWEKYSTEEKLLLCDLTRRVMDEDQFSAALNEFLNEISPKLEATGSETPTKIWNPKPIPSLAMYSRELYEAIEAYASDCTTRSKYDAVIEAATNTANCWLSPPSETKGTK